MTTFARVVDGIVLEVFAMPPQWEGVAITDLFHADLPGEWVEASDPQVAYGWRYDGSSFTPPPDG